MSRAIDILIKEKSRLTEEARLVNEALESLTIEMKTHDTRLSEIYHTLNDIDRVVKAVSEDFLLKIESDGSIDLNCPRVTIEGVLSGGKQ